MKSEDEKNARTCTQCGDHIPQSKRNDSRFCSNTCKARYWEQHKHEQPVTETKQETLDGTEQEDPNAIHIPTGQEGVTLIVNPEWRKQNNAIGTKAEYIKKMENQLAGFVKEKDETIHARYGWLQYVLGGLVGGVIAEKCSKDKKTVGFNRLVGAAAGVVAVAALRATYKAQAEAKIIREAAQFDRNIYALEQHIGHEKYLLQKEEKLLDEIRPIIEHPVPNFDNKTVTKSPKDKPGSTTFPGDDLSGEGPQIVNSGDLANMDFPSYPFTGKWLDFFGQPATNFMCILHGLPGEGKSTFAIQLAKYVAQNFGKTIYVSSEEGFVKTLKDKFTLSNANHPNLDIANARNAHQLAKLVIPGQFPFIVLDSLDTMHIETDTLRKLRKYYADSAIIAICQSTKDGKMRGSNEIAHDSDIVVQVINGAATTTKNRFKPKGMELRIFPARPKPPVPPKNTDWNL